MASLLINPRRTRRDLSLKTCAKGTTSSLSRVCIGTVFLASTLAFYVELVYTEARIATLEKHKQQRKTALSNSVQQLRLLSLSYSFEAHHERS